MDKLNPFPDYPVVRLQEEPGEIRKLTILTPAITRSRLFANQYVEQWNIKKSDPTQKVEPLIVAVKGDYGTGKTHLLLDSVAKVHQEFSLTYPDATILRISCLEADPVTWFQTTIGPELKRPFLQNIIIRLYARAGQIVALKTKLTEAAEQKLGRDPWSIHALIRENLLNITAVNQEFELLLNDVCRDASEEVWKALTGLVWAETDDAATRWLAGETLGSEELDKLHISRNLSTESDASGVLVVLAAVHSYLGTPFVLMIDELEHLTRYDVAHYSKRNITWLKRLLEGLANYQILVFIAGHWSTWEAQSDYLDRFSQLKPIELVRLTAADVLKIVQARVKDLSPDLFGSSQAEAIVEFGMGNIRRILSLCHVLFRESEGFRLPLNRDQICELAEQIGQRISIEDAMLRVHEILERKGLNIQREATIARGIRFDLIGYQGGQPKVVVELKHAITQSHQYDHARRFLEQMKEVYGQVPNVIGCFISDGNIDDELVSILRSNKQFRILWFDLTQRDVISKIVTELDTALKGGPKANADATRLQELLAQNEKLIKQIEAARSDENVGLMKQLQEQRETIEKQVAELRNQLAERTMDLEKHLNALEQKRSAELQELYARLEELTHEMRSRRDVGIIARQEEEAGPKLHATYAELTRVPSFFTKLRFAGENILFFSALFIILGIVVYIAVPRLAGLMTLAYPYHSEYELELSKYKYELLVSVMYLLSISGVLIGGWSIWRRIVQIDRFFDYSARLLREIYIRSADPQNLVKADNILRNSLEESGPVFGRKRAEELLKRTFPEIFDYLQ